MIHSEDRQSIIEEEHLKILWFGNVDSRRMMALFFWFGLLYAGKGFFVFTFADSATMIGPRPPEAPPPAIARLNLAPMTRLGRSPNVLALVPAPLLQAQEKANSPNPSPRPQSITRYQPMAGDFSILCTLFNGPPPGQKNSPSPIPITYDPRFIIGAQLESVTLGTSPWPMGSTVQFLIHSPSLLFGGYGFSGRKYVLTFSPFMPGTKDELLLYPQSMRYVLRWIEPAAPPQ
jgi:hypothetical protein